MQTIIKQTSGFITRLVNGELTLTNLCIIFGVIMPVFGLFVALYGKSTGAYYYFDNK